MQRCSVGSVISSRRPQSKTRPQIRLEDKGRESVWDAVLSKDSRTQIKLLLGLGRSISRRNICGFGCHNLVSREKRGSRRSNQGTVASCLMFAYTKKGTFGPKSRRNNDAE